MRRSRVQQEPDEILHNAAMAAPLSPTRPKNTENPALGGAFSWNDLEPRVGLEPTTY